MGKKDEKVEAFLHLLKKQSPLTLKQEKFCNRECVERFLKVKGDNVKKAAKQLSSCLSWRQNFYTERLGAEEFSTELADGVAYIAGHDEASRPVIIFHFKHDYQKLCTPKQFTRLVAFTMETTISSMSRYAEGEEKSREAFAPYLKFYRRPYDETAYRSKLRGPRTWICVSHIFAQKMSPRFSISTVLIQKTRF